MIIQCEKCRTKFRLDDSRVTVKGVKVRCAKCKNVFSVRKEEPEVALFEPSAEVTGFSSPAAPEEAPFATAEEADNIPAAAEPESFADTVVFEDDVPSNEPTDYSSFETSSFDASSISFEDELDIAGTENDASAEVTPAVTGGEVDFSGFDFGDNVSEPESAQDSTVSLDSFADADIAVAPAAPKKEAPQGLDFSDDDMFGAVVETTPEVSSNPITFDFDDSGFAESMDMGGQDGSGKSGSLFSLDTPSDAPFNLGEIDFGDELTSVAVQQVNPDDLKPSQDILFAPLAEAPDKTADDDLKRAFLGEDATDDQQDLPPLSISSRRKQSPLFAGVIAVVAVLAISVLGYIGYSSFSAPKEAASPEAGKIGVQSVKATYIENDEAGELLVVSGEALNEFSTPRAALQVKVMVFDATGQSIATKSAYGGNPLTDEQLESLPLAKIEAAMTNQFGDSLANMEVAPGKAIPFVVVLANLPKGAKDFGVQPVGSTVAAGKQQ